MTDETKAAVLAVLRKSSNGFAMSFGQWSAYTGLSRWKRFWNWLLFKLGADQQPFRDPCNFSAIVPLSLEHVADPKLIDQAMEELAPPSKCKVCGRSDLLQPDPSGYYCHAERYDGAPLLCNNMEHE